MTENARTVFSQHRRFPHHGLYACTSGLTEGALQAAYRELVGMGYVELASLHGHAQGLETHPTYRLTRSGEEMAAPLN
jgi:hypothetical protein